MTPEEKLDLYCRILAKEFRQELDYATAVHAGRASRREDKTDLSISIASIAVKSLMGEIPLVGSVLADAAEMVVDHFKERRHEPKSEKTALIQYHVHEDALGVLIEQIAKETARRYQYFITQRLSSESDIQNFAAVGARRMLKYYSDQQSQTPFSEEILLQGLIFADTSLISKTPLKDRITIPRTINADGAYSHCAVQDSTGQIYSFTSNGTSTKISTDAQKNSAAKYGFVNLPRSDRLFERSQLQRLTSGSNVLQRSMEYQPTWITIDYKILSDYEKQQTESSLLEYCKKRLTLPNATQLFYVPDHAASRNEKDLTRMNFAGKDLSFCDFRGCAFGGSLNHTKFVDSNLYDVDFSKVSSIENSNFNDATMEKLNAKGKRFHHCEFRGARLSHANLEGATISGGYDSSTFLPKERNYELSALHPGKLVAELRSRVESKQAQTDTHLIKINERLQQQATQLQKLKDFFRAITQDIEAMRHDAKMPTQAITDLKFHLKQQQDELAKKIGEIERLMSQPQKRGVSSVDLDLQSSEINSKLRALQQREETLRQTALGYCQLIDNSTQENLLKYRSTLQKEQARDKPSGSDSESIVELKKKIESLEKFQLAITQKLKHFDALKTEISKIVEQDGAKFPPTRPVEQATQASFDVTRHQDIIVMQELSQQRQDSERRQAKSEPQNQELVDQLRKLQDEVELLKKDQASRGAAVESSQSSISRSPQNNTTEVAREGGTFQRNPLNPPKKNPGSTPAGYQERVRANLFNSSKSSQSSISRSPQNNTTEVAREGGTFQRNPLNPPKGQASSKAAVKPLQSSLFSDHDVHHFDVYKSFNPSINYTHVLFALGLCGELDDKLSSYFSLNMETQEDLLDSHSSFDYVNSFVTEGEIRFNVQHGMMSCSDRLQEVLKRRFKEMSYSEKVKLLWGIGGAFAQFCEDHPDHIEMRKSLDPILDLIGDNLIKPKLTSSTSTKPGFFSSQFDGNSDLKDVKELLQVYLVLISVNLFFYKKAEDAGQNQRPVWGDDPQSLTCWLAANETVNAYFKCAILSLEEKDFYRDILNQAVEGVFPGTNEDQKRLD